MSGVSNVYTKMFVSRKNFLAANQRSFISSREKGRELRTWLNRFISCSYS